MEPLSSSPKQAYHCFQYAFWLYELFSNTKRQNDKMQCFSHIIKIAYGSVSMDKINEWTVKLLWIIL